MTSSERDVHSPIRIVLADANVLYSRVLRDYLLYAGAAGVLEIRWSAAILAEVVEHLAKNIAGFDAAAGSRLITAMNDAFPAAEVEPNDGTAAVIAGLPLPDEDDRHVLAAAVAVNADVLCTDNLKDFPTDVMAAVGIQLMAPDALLSRLISEFPREMCAAHRLAVSRLPGATNGSTWAALRRAGATGAAALLADLLDAGSG